MPAELIEDGQCPFPEIGEKARYTLIFEPASADTPAELRTEFTARQENLAENLHLLHCDGFAASYSGPLKLPPRVRGRLSAEFGALVPSAAQVTGTVRSRRMVTVTSQPDASGRHPRNGTVTLADVPAGRRGFDSGLVAGRSVWKNADGGGWVSMEPPHDRPWVREVGVLVGLDTDG
ncbi:hypothetical protein [Prescottella soli]